MSVSVGGKEKGSGRVKKREGGVFVCVLGGWGGKRGADLEKKRAATASLACERVVEVGERKREKERHRERERERERDRETERERDRDRERQRERERERETDREKS
jgi:hypothetical protein